MSTTLTPAPPRPPDVDPLEALIKEARRRARRRRALYGVSGLLAAGALVAGFYGFGGGGGFHAQASGPRAAGRAPAGPSDADWSGRQERAPGPDHRLVLRSDRAHRTARSVLQVAPDLQAAEVRRAAERRVVAGRANPRVRDGVRRRLAPAGRVASLRPCPEQGSAAPGRLRELAGPRLVAGRHEAGVRHRREHRDHPNCAAAAANGAQGLRDVTPAGRDITPVRVELPPHRTAWHATRSPGSPLRSRGADGGRHERDGSA